MKIVWDEVENGNKLLFRDNEQLITYRNVFSDTYWI